MGIGSCGVYQPTVTVLLEQNSSWSVHLFGKKVPAACWLLSEFPSKVSSPTIISQLISCVNEAKLCPGNVDNRYVDICEKRGGTMRLHNCLCRQYTIDWSGPHSHCKKSRM